MVLSNNFNRTVGIATLLLVWVIWGLSFLRPGVTSQVLAKLPSLSSSSSSASTDAADRPLVLYTYAESANARENLHFFVRNGLHARADFVFIFNGDDARDAAALLPRGLPNVRAVHRDNTCFDIGAYGVVLRADGLWTRYRRFILMNASVRGPFMPTYAPGCWMDAFLGRITDKVKLVGTTLNCLPHAHVQSMLLATDAIGMAILLDPALALAAADDNHYGTRADPGGLTPCFGTMALAVHAEIGLTALVESQGFAANVVMTAPHARARGGSLADFCDAVGRPDDFLYRDHYLGTTVHPYETVFMKANRDIDPVLLARLTEWHLAANMTSWEACGR